MSMFIRPSKRGWFIVLNAILWYLIARVNHNLIALILAWGSMALLVVSFISAFCSLKKIRFTRAGAPDAQIGRFINLPIRCDNLKRRKRQPFVIIEQLPFADKPQCAVPCPVIGARAELSVERNVMPVKRGEFTLNEITVRDSDPAGIFTRERIFKLPSTIIVYPHIIPIKKLYLPPQETLNAATILAPISASGNSQEFYGVREYHPTDGMRYIHWKSSAKHGKFMVREFERSSSLSVLMLVDFPANAVVPKTAANLETAVSLTASVCKYLANVYCTIAFGAGGSEPIAIQPQDAPVAVPNILYACATLKAGDVPLAQALETVAFSVQQNAVVYCFSLNDNPELKSQLETLSQRGMDIRWFMAHPDDFAPAKRKHKNKDKETDDSLSDFSLTPKRITPTMTSEDIFGY